LNAIIPITIITIKNQREFSKPVAKKIKLMINIIINAIEINFIGSIFYLCFICF